MPKRLSGAAQQPSFLRLAAALGLLILAVYLAGSARRADPTTGQERYDQLAGALDASHSLEQTFTAGRDNLCAINIFAVVPPGRLNPGRMLTLTLRDLDQGQEIKTEQYPLQSFQSNRSLTFAFSPQTKSKGHRYALRIETNAPADTVSLFASRDDAYFGGELLQDGRPLDRDLTFRTFTALAPSALLNDLVQRVPQYGLLLGVTLFFALAGGTLLVLIGYWPEASWSGRGLWMVGVGSALVPLLFFILGRQVWYGLGLLAAAAALRFAWQVTRRRQAGLALVRLPRLTWSDAALPALFLWAMAVRLLQAVDVTAPMWVDGVTHVQMVQSIADAGRIPGGLLYHVGFHTLVVLLGDLAHISAPTAIVLLGQWVSALGGPAVYVLARRMYTNDDNEGSSAAALLIAALLLTALPSLPGYLMNWGRYPFLFGLALLPFTLSATVDVVRAAPAKKAFPVYLLLALLLGGQFLSHYGTLSFWLSFSIVCLILVRPAWLTRLRDRQVMGKAALVLAALIALGLLVGFARFGDALGEKLGEIIAQSRQAGQDLDYSEIWQLNLRSGGVWLLGLGVSGCVAAVLRRRWTVLSLSAGWFLAQAALIAAQSPLLGYAIASYANLMLALALPLSLLAGDLLSDTLALSVRLPGQTVNWAQQAAVLSLVVLAVMGGVSQIGILNPTALLYSPDDAQAMEWIRARTVPEARFLINAGMWGQHVTPLDGGSWITTMTGRAAVPLSNKSQTGDLAAFSQQEHLQYVYLGRFSGFIQRQALRGATERFDLVYHQGGVEIYAVRP